VDSSPLHQGEKFDLVGRPLTLALLVRIQKILGGGEQWLMLVRRADQFPQAASCELLLRRTSSRRWTCARARRLKKCSAVVCVKPIVQISTEAPHARKATAGYSVP
jgi:hypothetical protein